MFRPKLRNGMTIEQVGSDTFLLLDGDQHIFEGKTYRHLLPLLTGQHDTSELMMKMSRYAFPPQVMSALTKLARQGLIVDGEDAPAEQSAYWQLQRRNAVQVNEQLAATPIALKTFGTVDAEPLQSALESLGVIIDATAPTAVVLTDDYLQAGLGEQNELALANGTRWLPVKLIGRSVWIGPSITPYETACWNCLANRVVNNRQVESYLLNKKQSRIPLPTSRVALPTTTNMVAAIAANEIAKWLVGSGGLDNQLLTIDIATMETARHTVVHRPQCKQCGTTELSTTEPQPVILQPCQKKFTRDGGHRAFLPEETFARLEHHISPITGVVSRLTNRLEVNGLTYSFSAGHNFAMRGDDIKMLQRNMRSQSGGKGRTRIQAQVSGVCEAIERYSGVYRQPHPHAIQASYNELGDDALHPSTYLLFSETQYANRYTWNAGLDAQFNLVSEPFNDDLIISWIPIWSLSEARFRYVPEFYCFYGHHDSERSMIGSDSNGCASGNTPEETILQGFLELAERDAVAIWWYNQIQFPQVDLDSFDTPYFQQLSEYYTSINRSLWVIDITNDLGIPTFVAISGRTDHEVEDIVVGLGAHLDPQIGIMRALTEVNQFLPMVNRRNADGSTIYGIDQDAIDWFKAAKMTPDSFLSPAPDVPARTLQTLPSLASNDLSDDVMYCVNAAKQLGIDTYVLDQTQPDIELNVFRVMAPGLRHFWRRLAPGRLYDVPVKMGWRATPIAEADVNPHSMFF